VGARRLRLDGDRLMARLRYNGLSNSLGASLSDSATSVTFASKLTHVGGDVPTITGTDYIPLSILDANGKCAEVVHLTAYTMAGTSGTVARGKEGSAGVAHDNGRVFVNGGLVADIEQSPFAVLAEVIYNPGTETPVSTTSTSLSDVDATNLAITFTAPLSGAVIVQLHGMALAASSSTQIAWGLREGSSDIANSSRIIAMTGSATSDLALQTGIYQFKVTGLTAGSSYTYKWAHRRRSGTGTAQTIYGGNENVAHMIVYAA
jgi:hypothetical protein